MIDSLRLYLKSSRPVSWVNTAYPFAAAYIVAAGQDRHITVELIIGTLFFLIPYNLMMYGVNDVFDYESDLLNARKGGIEGAVVDRHYHRGLLTAVIVTNVPFLIYLSLIGGWNAKAALAAVIFLVLAYSLPKLRFKERPFIDSLTSAMHFAGPMVYGLVLAGWQGYYFQYVVAFILWGMASHAFGAVQDIIPDRKAGLGSVGTVLGARRTVYFAMACYLLCAALLASRGGYAVVAGLVSLIYVVNIAGYYTVTDKDSERTNTAWRRFIYLNQFAGFVITLLIIRYIMTHSS